MFRRLADRVNDAVSNAASSLSNNNSNNNINNNNNDDARVSELSAMGFREAEARHALRVVNGDMTRATEWLLSNGSPVGTGTGTGTAGNPITISETGTTTTTRTTTTTHEDSELQHAIQASLMTENNHQQQRRRQQSQSAASKNAGRAAVSRTTSTNNNNNNITAKLKQNLSNTHPKVQMPKRLSQHDQEDIIMRCANRVAPYSLTVDTLLRSLRTIQADPSNRKYHAVDTTTAMFRRSLNAPGVLDFLKALNFHPNYNNHKTLTLAHFDAAAFYLGISALEQIQQSSPEYAKDKALRLFQKELASALATNTAEELSARTKFLSKLPSEPTKGSGGSQITVEYGIILNNNNNDTDTDTNNTPQSKITRGFDHDDTLGDVVNWLGGQASVIPDKLETGEWRLVDRNRRQDNDNDTGNGNGNGNDDYNYNYQRLDLAELKDRTLQYIGCWPSGRLAIVPKVIWCYT